MKIDLARTVIFFLAATLSAGRSATLAQWNTTGFTGSETTITQSVTTTGVMVSGFLLGSELSSTAGAGGMNTTSWSGATGATNGNHYGFTVTVAPNYQVTLTSLAFTARSSNTGPGNFGLYLGTSSPSLITSFSTSGDSFSDFTLNLSAAGTLGEGLHEFRIGLVNPTQSDGDGTVASNGTHRIMNFGSSATVVGATPITLTGSVIPEPGSASLVAAGFLILMGHRKRR